MKNLEINSERRRLSLSAKRVEDQVLPVQGSTAGPGAAGVDDDGELQDDEVRELGLSEDVFSDAPPAPDADAGLAESVADEPLSQDPDTPAADVEVPAEAVEAAQAAEASDGSDAEAGDDAAGDDQTTA